MLAIATAVTVQKKVQAVKVAAVNRRAKEIRHRQRVHRRNNVNRNIRNHHVITVKTQIQLITIYRIQLHLEVE